MEKTAGLALVLSLSIAACLGGCSEVRQPQPEGNEMLGIASFQMEDSAERLLIVGIDVNSAMIRTLTKSDRDFAGIAARPEVTLVHDDGRAFVTRTDRAFDVIQMSLVDTWAATGAGAFTLSENGLYTVQAWRTFLDRLKLWIRFNPWNDGNIDAFALSDVKDAVVAKKRNLLSFTIVFVFQYFPENHWK